MKNKIFLISVFVSLILIGLLSYDYISQKLLLNQYLSSENISVFEKLNILSIQQGILKCFIISTVGMFILLIGINLTSEKVDVSDLSAGNDTFKLAINSRSTGVIIMTLGTLLLVSSIVFKNNLSLDIDVTNQKYKSNGTQAGPEQ